MPERALLLACLLVTSGAASFACAGAQAAEPVSAPAVSAAPAPPSAPAPRPPAQHPFASTQAETTRLIDVAIDERAADLLSCIDAARPHRKNPHEKVQLEVALDQEGHLLGVKAPAGGSVDLQLNTCAQTALEGASFPRSHSGVITVVKSFQEQAFYR